jgi:hypothetical protein
MAEAVGPRAAERRHAALFRLLTAALAVLLLRRPLVDAAATPFSADGPALAVTTPDWSLFTPLGAPGRQGLLVLHGDTTSAFIFAAPRIKVRAPQGGADTGSLQWGTDGSCTALKQRAVLSDGACLLWGAEHG